MYFEPTLTSEEEVREKVQVQHIRKYLTSNVGGTATRGLRDVALELRVQLAGLQGMLHFIRFPTAQMDAFIDMAKSKNLKDLADTICATGGGAYKFETMFQTCLDMDLNKLDELDTLIQGLHFITKSCPAGCYYFRDPGNSGDTTKETYDLASTPYPFLVVNVGSGVSILAVHGPNNYRRVSGSSLGGGTFLGLSCLLTGCASFDEALELANQGDSTKVDKLVREHLRRRLQQIRLAWPSCGQQFRSHDERGSAPEAEPGDLVKATLITLTNNIGSLAALVRAKWEDRARGVCG